MNKIEKDTGSITIRRVILNLWPFFLALLIYICTRLAIRNPEFVETCYSNGVYPFLEKILSSVSGLIPFSIWDIFWSIGILLFLTGLVLTVFRKIKLIRFVLRTFQLLAILYASFYIVWGFNYFRPPIGSRLGWNTTNYDEKAFSSVFDTIIIKTNQSYFPVAPDDYKEIDSLVAESYKKNGKILGISFSAGRVVPKAMIYSSFFAKAGVNGYFGPFFSEINLNRNIYLPEYPFALAHEKAHQAGISNEAEANFAAYVICTLSGDRRLNYSGNLSTLIYFLSDAFHLKGYEEFVKKIDNRVILDLQNRRKYYQGIQREKLSKIQNSANNAYLKTNNISQGILNYDQVVSMVITWFGNQEINKRGNDQVK